MPFAAPANSATAMTQRVGSAARLQPQDALLLVRWATLALLLGLAFFEPDPTRLGWPSWTFILLFAVYAIPLDILLRRNDWPRLRRLRPILDLAVAGSLYLLNSVLGGTVYTLLFLIVVSAAAVLPLRAAFVYVVVVIVIEIGLELILRQPGSLNVVMRDLGAQLLRIVLVVVVAAILVRRLTLEQLATHRAQGEAEHLAELDRLRRNFVAAVSHDLQTPLTAARAGLGLLESSAVERLRQDERQLLANARRNIDRLGLQIDDLLSLNRIEAGEFGLTLAPLDVRAAIASAVAVTHPLVEQKGQSLQIDVTGPLPVDGDQRHLEQALVNLVANAHRHTAAGARIIIWGRETADGVLLRIEDDGPGIPPDAQQRIFDRFSQAGDSAGSGLGLAIVQAIVERHGGRVWVESAPGSGACFFVSLPRQTPPE